MATAYESLPVPVPTSQHDVLPNQSEPKLLSQTSIPVYVRSDDNWHRFSMKSGQYICIQDPLFLAPDSDPHYARFIPPLPAGIQLAYWAHWELIDSFPLDGPTKFTREVKWTCGTKTTETTTFSAELGASGGGISAKLSLSTGYSVEVAESREETQTFDFDIPKGEARVIAFWQLVESFRLVDSSGNLATYSGLWHIYDVDGDGNQARAWLDVSELVHRGKTLRLSQTSFSI